MSVSLSISPLSFFDSEGITKQQSHIDRLYVSLKDMVEHRKTKLEQQYWMYQLNREVEELEKWITEREAVASSTELGQDLEHVTVSLSINQSGNESINQLTMDGHNQSLANYIVMCLFNKHNFCEYLSVKNTTE